MDHSPYDVVTTTTTKILLLFEKDPGSSGIATL
jgi:hypothetical protein